MGGARGVLFAATARLRSSGVEERCKPIRRHLGYIRVLRFSRPAGRLRNRAVRHESGVISYLAAALWRGERFTGGGEPNLPQPQRQDCDVTE